MNHSIYCATFDGLSIHEVEVEASFIQALPAFHITGLAGNTIQESKQRIQSSLISLGFKFPPLKITINLSPSDLPKQGSFYDLPIALLIATHKLDIPNAKYYAFGELGLNGSIKDTASIYPILFALSTMPEFLQSAFFLPKEGQEIYSKIPHLQAYFVSSLQEALDILQNPPPPECSCIDFDFPSFKCNGESFFYNQTYALDFAEIKGQKRAKRAALISACGFHNIIFEGSPGSGKSMIASRIPSILPPLTRFEILQIASHGQSPNFSPNRPFRNPHNSATRASILGSATPHQIKLGEIALAHLGILFFDELPFFSKQILESLREPLQNHQFSLSRLHAKLTYPTDFLFIGAMNPCPCGNLLNPNKECRCTQKEITQYKNKLSEPFWDRIDLFVQMEELPNPHQTTSKDLHQQILAAFKLQKERHQTCFNARLSGQDLEKFCALESDEETIFKRACETFNLSERGKAKVLCVARSIADLDQAKNIAKAHLLEALSYRRISV